MEDNDTEFGHISTEKLHEDAVDLARRRWDMGFFWEVLRMLPAAEAAAGRQEASSATIAQLSGLLYEAFSAETDPKVQEALRPVYINYLLEHGAPSGNEAKDGSVHRDEDPGQGPDHRFDQ